MPPSDPADRRPWDRRPGESPQAHAAFRSYLVQDKRGFAALAVQIRKSRTLIARWSAEHEWLARALAYDHHMESIETARREKVRADNAEKWERRRQDTAEANWGASEKLRTKLVALIDSVTDGDKALPLTSTNVARLVKLAEMMMRLQSASLAEGRGVAEDDGFDPLAATPEQLRAYLASKGVTAPTGPGSAS